MNDAIAPKLTKREKFDLRMDRLPANSSVNVVIITGDKGQIEGWAVGTSFKIEGMHEYVDVTEQEG